MRKNLNTRLLNVRKNLKLKQSSDKILITDKLSHYIIITITDIIRLHQDSEVCKPWNHVTIIRLNLNSITESVLVLFFFLTLIVKLCMDIRAGPKGQPYVYDTYGWPERWACAVRRGADFWAFARAKSS